MSKILKLLKSKLNLYFLFNYVGNIFYNKLIWTVTKSLDDWRQKNQGHWPQVTKKTKSFF